MCFDFRCTIYSVYVNIVVCVFFSPFKSKVLKVLQKHTDCLCVFSFRRTIYDVYVDICSVCVLFQSIKSKVLKLLQKHTDCLCVYILRCICKYIVCVFVYFRCTIYDV